jgi:hypothetical protein
MRLSGLVIYKGTAFVTPKIAIYMYFVSGGLYVSVVPSRKRLDFGFITTPFVLSLATGHRHTDNADTIMIGPLTRSPAIFALTWYASSSKSKVARYAGLVVVFLLS